MDSEEKPFQSGFINKQFISSQNDQIAKNSATEIVKPDESRKRRAGNNEKLSVQAEKTKKKIKKSKGKLSFLNTDDYNDTDETSIVKEKEKGKEEEDEKDEKDEEAKRKLIPKSSLPLIPRAITKSVLAKEAEIRDKLRKEFLEIQESVKNTEIAIPFTFYDGAVRPGGICRILKGDHIWFFLDKARKVGAGLGVGSGKGWARISVDDLLLVSGDIIIPHHHEIYYFLVNKTMGFQGRLFDYSSDRTDASPPVVSDDDKSNDSNYDPLNPKPSATTTKSIPLEELEGYSINPSLNKVVDRRWYERNKHIYPASLWEAFDENKDYTTAKRKDTSGNVLFYA